MLIKYEYTNNITLLEFLPKQSVFGRLKTQMTGFITTYVRIVKAQSSQMRCETVGFNIHNNTIRLAS